MTDTMTIQAMLAEITLGRAQTPRYKVRLFDEDGDRVHRILSNTAGHQRDVADMIFLDAKDVEEKLMPMIETHNRLAVYPVYRVEAYFTREVNVASLDLTIQKPSTEVTTTAGEWKPLD
jgi:hypothetical protein